MVERCELDLEQNSTAGFCVYGNEFPCSMKTDNPFTNGITIEVLSETLLQEGN
jgi:hypothetical protein